MKKYFLMLLIPFLAGCDPIGSNRPAIYTEYVPTLISKNSLKSSINLKPSSNIGDAAKIYYKDNFIYISERFKGVHIIDNSNPKLPVNKGYISIPGCVDMAIKENILYVDNAIDLVAINLSDVEKGQLNVVKRIENVFPEVAPPDGGVIPVKFNAENRPENTVIINWKKK